MASTTEKSICFCLCLFLFLYLSTSTPDDPVPALWPKQFHSVLFLNRSGSLRKTDLWYDWPNGRIFNIFQNQLGVLKYDLAWSNRTSFFYTLDPFNHTCEVLNFDVGNLPPNWLHGANYLGQKHSDNFLCNVWEKDDFIWYYEDVVTRRPVKKIFHDGMITDVMTFEVRAVLDDAHWQAPVYCFSKAEPEPQQKYLRRTNYLLDFEDAVEGGFGSI